MALNLLRNQMMISEYYYETNLGNGGFYMFYAEARELYANVHTQARKVVNDYQKMSADPYLNDMDNEVDDSMITQKVDLGILEIPVRQIVGVASTYPDMEYTHDFKPLAQTNSEFAESWCQLYLEYLSDRGLTEPIECIEYLGRFYVVDGKKRVSVLKAHGELRVNAHVTRWVPERSSDVQVKQYYDFLNYFPKTGLYQVFLSDAADFQHLQKEMGLAPDQVWTDTDRYHFMFTFISVERAHLELFGEYASVTAADAFVALLKKYSFSQLSAIQPWDLVKVIAEVMHFNPNKTAA